MKISFVYSLIVGESVPAACSEIIEENRALCERNRIPFVLECFPQWGKPWRQGSLLKCIKATVSPGMLYLDWDCRLLEIPDDLRSDRALFGKDKNGNLDYFAFFVGRRSDTFCALLSRESKVPMESMGAIPFLRTHREEVDELPASMYVHHGWHIGH